LLEYVHDDCLPKRDLGRDDILAVAGSRCQISTFILVMRLLGKGSLRGPFVQMRRKNDLARTYASSVGNSGSADQLLLEKKKRRRRVGVCVCLLAQMSSSCSIDDDGCRVHLMDGRIRRRCVGGVEVSSRRFAVGAEERCDTSVHAY
jgi:hypothetical protein